MDLSEITARPAQSAAQGGRTSGTNASASPSGMARQSGSATTAGTAGVSDAAQAYCKTRGISPQTLELLGVKSGTGRFADGKKEAIFWPYYLSGEMVNWKAGSIEAKAFTGMPGGKMCLFNQGSLTDTVYICEGEFDMASLVEAGVPVEQVTTVPNGANPGSYPFIQDALEAGWSPTKVVLATDNDDPGLMLRQTLAHIFGPAVCSFVDFPDGCKDANDLLRSDGPEALLDLVENGALPWPVEGLYRLSEIPEPAPRETWDCGFPEWEGKISLGAGMLSVVTGLPGHGKTQLFSQIWQQIARRYAITVAMASFETRAKPDHRRTLRSLINGFPENAMSPEQKRHADEWIDEHYLWIDHPKQRPTLDWLLDTAEVAVVRHGVRAIVIDPWNRLEHDRGNESESDFIGRALTACYKFAVDMNVHLQILAHPAKMDQRRRDMPPALDDIAGSAHWNNRPDHGFVVHRETLWDADTGKRGTSASLYCRKARFPELGYPCKLDLEYDPLISRYRSADYLNGMGQPV
jgi:twinkle protein